MKNIYAEDLKTMYLWWARLPAHRWLNKTRISQKSPREKIPGANIISGSQVKPNASL
jgi:hypothetical protein